VIACSTAARPCGESADNGVVGLCVMLVPFSDKMRGLARILPNSGKAF
jgi:hypothetical protein